MINKMWYIYMAISTPMNCGSKGEYYTVHVGGTSLFLINLYVNMVHVLCEISLLNAKRSNSLNYFTTSSFLLNIHWTVFWYKNPESFILLVIRYDMLWYSIWKSVDCYSNMITSSTFITIGFIRFHNLI